tara:strand:- start:15 stop:608 length:594 start_codon:yes stop_codon:yes gene_type:complete
MIQEENSYNYKKNDSIVIKNKTFIEYITKNEIEKIINNTSNNINEFYKNDVNETNPLIIIGVLNGAFMFLSDLVKKINLPCEIHFIKVSSYEGTESVGKITNILGLSRNINNLHVLIVEDIIDTGLTINNLISNLSIQNPKSLNTCALLWKKCNYKNEELYEALFIGKIIPDKFVIGYGLDYDKFGRNLDSIYVLDP